MCSLSGEPDFRDGFRNWIKTQVYTIVFLGFSLKHKFREEERVEEAVCLVLPEVELGEPSALLHAEVG